MNPVFQEAKYIPGLRGKKKDIPPVLIHEDMKERKRRKDEILNRLTCVLGGLPPRTHATAEILHKYSMEDYTRVHLTIHTLDDDKIPAYLLIPDKTPESGFFKGVLAMHETCFQGKDEPAGISGHPNFFYGLDLVKRGFIVLIPDVDAAGERVKPGQKPYMTNEFYNRYPNWSYMGKMLFDHRQCMDYLLSREDTDHSGVAVIGHSKGGYNAIFLSAFDERVKVTVSSCGYQPVTGERDKKRWVRSGYEHFKPIKECVVRYNYYPFEFHEVLACIAPRAFFSWYTRYDHCFPNYKGVEKLHLLTKGVYEQYGKSNLFYSMTGSEGHDFPLYARERAYEFIEQHL